MKWSTARPTMQETSPHSVGSTALTDTFSDANLFSIDEWPYQSNGRCTDLCKANYAFAIVQDQNCWCGDYIPAEQSRVDRCSRNCPGYPDEKCGDIEAGLFGYIALNKDPVGTAGAPSQVSALFWVGHARLLFVSPRLLFFLSLCDASAVVPVGKTDYSRSLPFSFVS